jgi:hypothetical protein
MQLMNKLSLNDSYSSHAKPQVIQQRPSSIVSTSKFTPEGANYRVISNK